MLDDTIHSESQALDYLQAWAHNPARFAYDVFGIEAWDRQQEMLQSAVDHDHFAWKTGHKTGKSMSVAIIAIWWALTRPNARVGITSSSFLQVKKIIWREIKRLYRMAKVDIGGKLFDDPRTGLTFGDGNEIFGFSTTDVENAAGFSSPNNLFLIDEASGRGIEVVYEALEGNIAGGGKIGMFGNPTRTSGTFFDAFTNHRSIWHAKTISSEETPNVKEGKVIVPGLATAKWIGVRKSEWGVDHPLYQIRVAGNFPKFTDNAIIPYYLLTDSQLNWRSNKFRHDGEEIDELAMIKEQLGPIRIGLDVARYGQDESVIQCVRGHVALEPRNFHGLDGVELANELFLFVEQLRDSGYFSIEHVPVHVNVDEIGVGVSPWDHLKHATTRCRALNMTVKPISMSAEPHEPSKYLDPNTEMLFTIREWLQQGGMLPENPKLEKELLFATYLVNEKMQMHREHNKKAERLAENLGHSPDNRDALGLALYNVSRSTGEFISDGRRETGTHLDQFEGVQSPGFEEIPYLGGGDDWVRSFTG